MHVDGLTVVSEPSMRGLAVAAEIGTLAADLGLTRQTLVLNRYDGDGSLPTLPGLPNLGATIPALPGLLDRQLTSASVMGLPESMRIDSLVDEVLAGLR